MPVKGKLPRWERSDNRSVIFKKVLDKSQTFTELLNDTGFSRATLSNHLTVLQDEGLIEKALEDGRVVYTSILDEEKIKSEFKKMNYDFLIEMLDEQTPSLGLFFQMLMIWVVKSQILQKRRILEGKPPLTKEEFLEISPKLIAEGILETDPNPDHVRILRKAMDRLLLDTNTDDMEDTL